MNRRTILLLVAAIALLVVSISIVRHYYRPESTAESDEGQDFIITGPRLGVVRLGIESPALVEPYRHQVIRSPGQSRITFVGVLGSSRSEGDVLIRFESSEAQSRLARAELDYQESELALSRADRNLEQSRVALQAARDLHAAGAASGEEVSKSEEAMVNAGYHRQLAELSLEKSRLDLERARMDLESTIIRAPFDGQILEVSVQPGDIVGSNTALMTFGDVSRVRLVAEMDEYDAVRIVRNQRAEAQAEALRSSASSTQAWSGRVDTISPVAKIVSNISVFTVGAVFDNEDQLLRPGMSADLTVIVAQDRGLIVPAGSISTVRDRSYLDVMNSEGEIEPRRVVTGASDGVQTVILEGIGEDDQIVVYQESSLDILAGSPSGADPGSSSFIPISVPGSSGGSSSSPASPAGGGGGGGGGGR
ncbi:RND family efflux transporter, MFP subunit [Alkalispirochaeta americana]|uniref:RND family efflux transporter, MFP subunit n=1 Tax=Alkalispirochaeta americana TaxID=159291 RepID=A0A1N6WMY7_9SPIO|nr:efflux RND transporter periplasmic adaptor subunit [Alkalispirochaeta americana]SIQ91439.1 RND family efflux transporter, MFP subunit [Alkalispirochaeta americana]